MKSLNKVQSHLIAECFNKLYIGGQFVDAIDGDNVEVLTVLVSLCFTDFTAEMGLSIVQSDIAGPIEEEGGVGDTFAV